MIVGSKGGIGELLAAGAEGDVAMTAPTELGLPGGVGLGCDFIGGNLEQEPSANNPRT